MVYDAHVTKSERLAVLLSGTLKSRPDQAKYKAGGLVGGENSFMLFRILNVDQKWLVNNPKEWDEEPGYTKIKDFVRTVKTVNNCAEMGVKVVQFACLASWDS